MSQSNRMAEFRHQDREGYLRWDDTSADDQDIWPVELPQFLDELWDEGLVSRGKSADPDAVHVCVDRLLGDLQRSLFKVRHGKTQKAQRCVKY